MSLSGISPSFLFFFHKRNKHKEKEGKEVIIKVTTIFKHFIWKKKISSQFWFYEWDSLLSSWLFSIFYIYTYLLLLNIIIKSMILNS